MGSNDERALAHAWMLRSRGAALPPGGLPPPEILDSWVRCSRAGLDVAASPPIQVVDGGDLAQSPRTGRGGAPAGAGRAGNPVPADRRLELPAGLRRPGGRGARPLRRQPLPGPADRPPTSSPAACGRRRRPAPTAWGTALATGRPVAVNGLEHFLRYGDISCTAAPIRDAFGRWSARWTPRRTSSRASATQALVQMAA